MLAEYIHATSSGTGPGQSWSIARTLRRQVVWIVLAVTALRSPGASNVPICFEVGGFIIQEQFDPTSGLSVQTDRIDFSVVVSNRHYTIYSKKLYLLGPGEVAELVTGSDGMDVFSVAIAPAPHGNVVVAPGTMPIRGLVHEHLLWLTYCAAGYVEELTNHPARYLDDYLLSGETSHMVDVDLLWREGPPAFPEVVCVRRHSQSCSDSHHQNHVSVPNLLTQLRVLETRVTEFGAVPAVITVTNYLYITRAGSLAPTIRSRFWITATNIHSCTKLPNQLTPLPRPYRCFDSRFKDRVGGKDVEYVVSSNPFLPREHPVALNGLVATLREETAQLQLRQENAWKRSFVLALLGATALGFMWIVVKTYRNTGAKM